MKNKQSIYFLVLHLLFATALNSCSQSKTSLVPIDHGWAKNSINTVIFRKNSVVSWEDQQFVAYYDSVGHVVLAKRHLNSNKWEKVTTDYKGNVADAHNSISIMVDGDGFLHMSWDHHNTALNYCKSTTPGSLQVGKKQPMTGKDENSVSYPEFYRLANGNLLFLYRNGESGKGNLVVNQYDSQSKKWTRIHDNLIDGENERNAYWQAFVDKQGIIHLSWVWRETWDVATNHDICYMRSRDGGISWENSTGVKYEIPVNLETAEYAAKISQNSELINQTSMFADENSKPYIAMYWLDTISNVPQYHLVYHDGKKWRAQVITDRKEGFSLSGGGTKAIPISRPQIISDKENIIMIYRDHERSNKVSLSICKNLRNNVWETLDLTDFSVGSWEPGYDTELWKSQKKLHLFVQKTLQGDQETLSNSAPTMVYILEWN